MGKKSDPPFFELTITQGERGMEVIAKAAGVDLPLQSPSQICDTPGGRSYDLLCQARHYLGAAIRDPLVEFINCFVRHYVTQAELDSVDSKRTLVRKLNHFLSEWGYYIRHPETKQPCLLLVVSDKWGGKFVLEDRQTRKRSNTTGDILKMLPFSVVFMADEA